MTSGGEEQLPQTAAAWHQSRYGSLDQSLVDRRERWLVRSLLRPYQGQLERVLDAPAGYGRFSGLLTSLGPRAVVALDLHPLRLSCVPRHPGLVRVLADLDRLPFAPRSFDLVTCLRHLQHLREPGLQARRLALLAESSARLLLVSYYAPGGLHGLQRRALSWVGRRRSRLGATSPAWISQRLEEVEFQVLCDKALLPGLHAQRLLLAERRGSWQPDPIREL